MHATCRTDPCRLLYAKRLACATALPSSRPPAAATPFPSTSTDVDESAELRAARRLRPVIAVNGRIRLGAESPVCCSRLLLKARIRADFPEVCLWRGASRWRTVGGRLVGFGLGGWRAAGFEKGLGSLNVRTRSPSAAQTTLLSARGACEAAAEGEGCCGAGRHLRTGRRADRARWRSMLSLTCSRADL